MYVCVCVRARVRASNTEKEKLSPQAGMRSRTRTCTRKRTRAKPCSTSSHMKARTSRCSAVKTRRSEYPTITFVGKWAFSSTLTDNECRCREAEPVSTHQHPTCSGIARIRHIATRHDEKAGEGERGTRKWRQWHAYRAAAPSDLPRAPPPGSRPPR